MSEEAGPVTVDLAPSKHHSRTSARAEAESHVLKGKIGTIELVMTVLAFSAPIVVVASFAPFVVIYDSSGAPLAYVVGVILLLLFAVGYTAMSRYLPNAGAFYAYITAGLGRPMGLGASLVAMLGYTLMAVGTAAFFGLASQALLVDVFHGPNIAWQFWSLACLLGTGVLGYFRIDLSAKVLSVAMTAEVAIVLIFDIGVFGRGGPQGRSLEPFALHAFTSGSVGLAVLFAATSFLGFEATAVFREETKDPDKVVPRATYAAVVFIGIFYIIAVFALITAYGHSHAQDAANNHYATMFTDAMQTYVGGWARDVVQVLVVSSAFACLLSVQNIMSRYVFSLGVDGVLPALLGRAHRKHGSPSVASVAVSILLIAILATQMGQQPAVVYGKLSGTGGFAILILMFLTGVSVVAFFRKRPDARAPIWHRLIAPTVSAASMAMVIYLATTNFETMTGGSKTDAVTLQIIVWGTYAVGVVLAYVYKAQRPEVFTRIGRQEA